MKNCHSIISDDEKKGINNLFIPLHQIITLIVNIRITTLQYSLEVLIRLGDNNCMSK